MTAPLLFLIALPLGIAVGAWGYRYLLKRNPSAIERLAAQARQFGDRF